MIKNKNILITGGTGSFGKYFAKTLLEKFSPNKVIIFSRDEQKQFSMHTDIIFKKYKKKLRFFVGDIRDEARLTDAMNGVDIVVHAAALKIIDTAEYNPMEFIKTNIMGSQNVVTSALKNNVKKVVALSTDKATSPINLYGATKLCAEKLFVSSNNYRGTKKTSFSVVRYGNVMGSRGSVIPFFLKIKNSKVFTVTDKDMTRFNMTLDESASFVMNCINKMAGGEVFVPKLPSYKILDVVKAIEPKNKIKFIGRRPGEKIHEEMVSNSDAHNTYEYKNYFIIYSDSLVNENLLIKIKKDLKKRLCKKTSFDFNYSSDQNKKFLTINELRNLINKHVEKI